MMEAALVAISGKGRPLTRDEYNQILDQLGVGTSIAGVKLIMDAIVTAGNSFTR
jgi:hypothetical protein